MIGNIIGAFIVLLIGFTLHPTIKSEVTNFLTNSSSNLTNSASQTVISLIPFLFMSFLVAFSIGLVLMSLRDFGLVGSKYMEEYEKDFEEKVKENPNHKQTYKEYVQEMLEAQKMIKRG